VEDIGTHYALTLHEWRRRFLDRLPEVRHLGFDERFVRMWDYYLAYCEGAFRERYISDVQLVLVDRSINALQRQGYARRRTTTAHAAR
jgi:cyclopropane-fatty-acyl-phospholipid synthase